MTPPPRDPLPEPRHDLARTTLVVLFIGAMLAASLWIARPFIGPAIWATMLVVATWPLMLKIQRLLWRSRTMAVVVMTLLLVLAIIVPLTLAIATIVDSADDMMTFARSLADYHLPEKPPEWLANLPLVGGLVQRVWDQAAALGVRDLWPRVSPYAGNVTRWFVSQVGTVGGMLVQFLVTVVIAAVMYGTGEEGAELVRRFARRLGGERGVGVVELSAGAIRGVALGVGATAAVQALIAGIGLAIAGVPFAGLLTALTFMLSLAQVGPLPVLLPAAAWLFYTGSTGWGIFLLVVSGVVAVLDNVLRPLFIRMGADLSLLLIFTGVLGGLLAFGLVGLFVGPLVLTVGWTLLDAWMADGEKPAETIEAKTER